MIVSDWEALFLVTLEGLWVSPLVSIPLSSSSFSSCFVVELVVVVLEMLALLFSGLVWLRDKEE